MSEEHEFYRFNDLLEKGIVSSRYSLHWLIKDAGFPRPIKNAPVMQGAAFYNKKAVHEWLDARPRKTKPKFHYAPKPGSKPVGRPRKRRVVAETGGSR